MTRIARRMEQVTVKRKADLDEYHGSLSLHVTLYIPYTQPGELTVLRSGEVTGSAAVCRSCTFISRGYPNFHENTYRVSSIFQATKRLLDIQVHSFFFIFFFKSGLFNLFSF